jgi:uncharacterized protein YecE (DUF72 family)
MGEIRIGTSGYLYQHWRGVLYPERLATARWLRRYAEVFDTLELNSTFYRLSTPTAAERWRAETPPGFVFAAKGSRFITHMKKLNDPRQALQRLFAPLRPLGSKLRVILWQLPPRFQVDALPRLEAFLRLLPRRYRHAVEFREASWYLPEVAAVLARHETAFCEHDLVPLPAPSFTGGFRYLRFHGATGKYDGRYGAEGLRDVGLDLRRWRRRGRDAYVFFNNDIGGHAVHDALALRLALGDTMWLDTPRPSGPKPQAPP